MLDFFPTRKTSRRDSSRWRTSEYCI